MKPKLVNFQTSPKRDRSDLGMIKNIHAICHIEFNAINLALDAVYRFQEMPLQYYLDWLKVANEEATHFSLLSNYLQELGYQYGDFDAHNGLWQMTVDTDYDVLSRMALVPRVLEARGLDVTPSIRAKFKDSNFHKMVEILDIIYRDEIGHVKIGNYWYHYLCGERKPNQAAFQLVLDNHNLIAERTLFIDDSIQHIEGARSLGLQAYHLVNQHIDELIDIESIG